MFRNSKRVALAGLVLGVWGVAYAQTAQLEKGGVELFSYESYDSGTTFRSLDFSPAFNGGLASLDVVRTFDGFDASGQAAQMTVTAQGTGQASSNALKASALISVSNPVLAEGMYSRDTLVQGSGWLIENVVVGNASVTSIRFGFRIDGTLSTSEQPTFGGYIDPSASVALFQGEGLNFNNAKNLYSRYNSNPQSASFDDYILTNAINVVGGAATLNVQLVAQAAVSIFQLGGGDYAAQSLFNHTASLIEVYGYDSAGAQVALPDVRTNTGFVYQAASVTAVPEPEQYALLLAGLGVIAGVAGRRRAHVQRGKVQG